MQPTSLVVFYSLVDILSRTNATDKMQDILFLGRKSHLHLNHLHIISFEKKLSLTFKLILSALQRPAA